MVDSSSDSFKLFSSQYGVLICFCCMFCSSGLEDCRTAIHLDTNFIPCGEHKNDREKDNGSSNSLYVGILGGKFKSIFTSNNFFFILCFRY